MPCPSTWTTIGQDGDRDWGQQDERTFSVQALQFFHPGPPLLPQRLKSLHFGALPWSSWWPQHQFHCHCYCHWQTWLPPHFQCHWCCLFNSWIQASIEAIFDSSAFIFTLSILCCASIEATFASNTFILAAKGFSLTLGRIELATPLPAQELNPVGSSALRWADDSKTLFNLKNCNQ